MRRARAAWTGRRCVTGCIATMARDCRGCRTGAVGPRPRLSPEQAAVVAELVRAGPDPAVHGVVRWRRADLATVVEARFNVTLAERTVGAPRPALPLGLSVRRRLPGPRRRRRTGATRRQRPRDEPAFGRDQPPGRTRRRLFPCSATIWIVFALPRLKCSPGLTVASRNLLPTGVRRRGRT